MRRLIVRPLAAAPNSCRESAAGRPNTRRPRRRPRAYESLESRHLLAGDVVAQWVADDLVAELPDGGTLSAWNDSISGISATAIGSPELILNQNGGRALVRFDAADGVDRLSIATQSNPLTGASDFSVAVLFRTDSTSLQGDSDQWFRNTGIVDANQLGIGMDWGLSINAAGQLSTGLGGGFTGTTKTIYSTASGLNDGQLHTAVITRQGGTLTLYVDQRAPDQMVDASPADRSRLDMTFGSLSDGVNGFTGELGQVRIYSGALTAEEAAAVQIEIQAYYNNQVPVARDDEYFVNEDSLLAVLSPDQGVLQNDSDAEGDALTVSIVSPPEHGNLVLNANGTLIYDSDRNFNGVDQFTYTASDFRPSNVATVTLNVVSVYDPAVAVDDSYRMRPDQTLSIDAITGLLSNDRNSDNADLKAVLADNVSDGDLTLRDDGSFVYAPSGFAGETSFTYQVDDGTSLSSAATVTLVVNTPPVANADFLDIIEDTPFLLTGPGGILSNDIDQQPSNTLTATVLNEPTRGTIDVGADGGLTYVPELNYVGPDSFTYRLSDGHEESGVVTATLSVLSVNDAPVTIEDAYFVLPGGRLDISATQGLLANDFDVEGQSLTASLASPASNGDVQLAGDGSFQYTPDEGFLGDDVFSYVASDGKDGSQATQVVISVVEQPLVINEILALNTGSLATRTREPTSSRFSGDDQWYDWVEIRNRLPRPLDVGGLHLTDDSADPTRWQFPAGTEIPANGYVVVFASGLDVRDPSLDELGMLHTNFRLSSDGEYLALTNVDGSVIDELAPQFPAQATDVSYGLDGESFRYFTELTPGEVNGQGLIGFASGVTFDAQHGFFTDAFSLTMAAGDAASTIRYTTDGSEPTAANGIDYSSPLLVDGTLMVRAAAFKDNFVRSVVTTQTYLFLADVLRQSPDGSAPEGWPARPVRGQAFDYGMDPDIVDSPTWGAQLNAALLQVPSISLVTDQANLTDSRTGIYVNAQRDGREWERPASMELLNPDGTSGFQIDAGLRIRGGFSRGGFNPKHSFRLFFRDEYDGALEYPMFEDEGVDSLKNVDLRTAQNYAWSNDTFNDQTRNSFLRDVYSRDLQRELGQPYTRSRYYHLYLNGQYWGLYQTEERPEASYAESYLGGKDDNYDVVKASGGTLEATDGKIDAWTELWRLANAGFNSLDDYFLIQGRNADGTENLDREVQIQIDILIDFMINVTFTGNEDMPTSLGSGVRPNNFYAIRNTKTRDGWQLVAHDNEHNMLKVNYDQTRDDEAGRTAATFNPKYLHQQLDEFPEYQIRFADRVQRFFFNDGPLTVENSQKLMQARAGMIDQAIIAESARWGDQHNNPPLTKDTWTAEVDWLLNTFLARRRDVVLRQLRAKGLYPDVEAAELNQHGGLVDRDFQLDMTAPQGTIWYTLDGSDPREVGGAINPNAQQWSDTSSVVLTEDGVVMARVRMGGQWSALTEAEFFVGPAVPPDALRISEINYHPSDPTDAERAAGFNDGDDFEFIELVNTSSEPIDLSQVQFVRVTVEGDRLGVDFDFGQSPIQRLIPGGRVIVAEDTAALRFRYGDDMPLAGQWSGGLGNGGEVITLQVGAQVLQQFAYDDAWYAVTDGGGSSLEIVDANHPDLNRWGQADGWQPSSVPGGTPGGAPIVVGDVNDDGVFGPSDLIIVLAAGEYEDNIASNSTYAEGDWNGDGDFTTSDLVFALQTGSYVAAAQPRQSMRVDSTGSAYESLFADFDDDTLGSKRTFDDPSHDTLSLLASARLHDRLGGN